MCANCVNRLDVALSTAAIGAYLFKEPVHDALVGLGLAPERHPLARDMRAVNFLRDLDLDPVEILGAETVAAVDVAQAHPRERVYRRSFREALTLLTGRAMRSQRALATK